MPAKTKRKREPKINAENYLKWVALDEQDLQRDPGDIAKIWEIATMHWTFGDIESARRWYEKSIPMIRERANGRPLESVAFTYWKAGLLDKMAEECRGVTARRREELPGLEAAYNEAPVKKDEVRLPLFRAYGDLALVCFLLGSHREAREWGERSMAINMYGTSVDAAVAALAGALERDSAEDYEKALRFLRSIVRPWPTFMSGSHFDLYRRALALAKERFGSIPADLVQDELRGSLFGPPVVKRERE